ncbi:uncharacterized protein EV420DRAFT_273768 [Desarmillaria tabescens]|uniref:Uncharacterized protein n=1 Tax=Armillaria tabescens TaxID=1929756 RepID=A0AA39KF23_ARMTA|nr:uncharacterized protein EV420DRAFT_273768 [Desarmillaria tabescens]KAK0459563.1 hypothetical protein EV420DRAFT_273768 [Desarmillaria tabescens]
MSAFPSALVSTSHPRLSSMSSKIFSLARSKLNVSVGSKDNVSLHRWVLIKNSIIQSSHTAAEAPVEIDSPQNDLDLDSDSDSNEAMVEQDSFLFPDVTEESRSSVGHSEAQWLDCMLEIVDDDEDSDDFSSGVQVSVLPADDDDDTISPLPSPMSSSDDLTNPAYFATPMTYSYPYPVPYPPYHPPLISPYHLDSTVDSSLSAPYDDPLPYYDLDDVEDLPVPDAIEDTSDDESDAPTTPSLDQSTSLTLDPASIPLPTGRSRLRHPDPRVYSEADDSFFKPFEFDALPFSHVLPSYSLQEC